ncbi:MAG: hypothetical protein ABI220_04290 [Candidatus Saccharimonadales bacterium]
MRKDLLTEDCALVLQQVHEIGKEEVMELAESLRFDHSRLLHIIQVLHNRGLVRISRTTQGMWVSLSRRGYQIIRQLWPEWAPSPR